MNQKNGKNSLGLDSIFEDLDNPIDLFKNWFKKAEEKEINDEDEEENSDYEDEDDLKNNELKLSSIINFSLQFLLLGINRIVFNVSWCKRTN